MTSKTLAVRDDEGRVVGRIRTDREADYTRPAADEDAGILRERLYALKSGKWVHAWYSIWQRGQSQYVVGDVLYLVSPELAVDLIAAWGYELPDSLAHLAPMLEGR